jgi:acetyltransferase-like isoleucine patch superfamily enzyme
MTAIARRSRSTNAPITIGDSVWVATRAAVLRGVTVGDGATIGAHALVSPDVPVGGIVLVPVQLSDLALGIGEC